MIEIGIRNNREWRLLVGDSRGRTAHLEPSSVDTIVTSPPYFWQRDYGMDDQIGLEDSLDGYIAAVTEVMAGCRRALRRHGTAFVVVGDTYYSCKGRSGGRDDKQPGRRFAEARLVERAGFGLPRKSLIGVPWRLAFALQADGWTLRSAIVWQKGNRMEEPKVVDRPWATTEMVLMLTRDIRYHFDRSALGGDEDVWRIPANNALRRFSHAAPFPLALAERCIAVGCPPSGTVLDPFAGSGTTMLAACDMGRDAIGIELNPDYARTIAARLEGC